VGEVVGEVVASQLEELRVLENPDGRRAWLVVQERELAEVVAGMQALEDDRQRARRSCSSARPPSLGA
jgi:hypothetical protein